MDTQKMLVASFYEAFSKRDAEGMIRCYADDIVFSDAVFGLLDSDHTRAMWRMLCAQAKDFSLSFSDIQLLDDEYATCKWTARYTFSKTGKKVVNNVKAHMRIVDGKIAEHSDQFNLYVWARQALGIAGFLFGWSNFVQKKIHLNARKSLEQYMQRQQPI